MSQVARMNGNDRGQELLLLCLRVCDVHGPHTDDPILRMAANDAYYYHQDGLGSVVALTGATGTTVALQQFDAWGNRLAAVSGGVIPQYGYTGREPDETGLIYYRARYYDPAIGRFTQRDPIGLEGGINQYSYVENDPINLVDPEGLAAQGPTRNSGSSYPSNSQAMTRSSSQSLTSSAACKASCHGFQYKPGQPMSATSQKTMAAVVGVLSPTPVGKVSAIRTLAGVAKGAEKGGLNLFKWGKDSTTKADGWKKGDFMLNLPDKGSPKANWAQNSGRLREEMGKGNPIYDSYRNPTGERIPTEGFLRAERNLLESRGWQYNSSTGAYHPPGN